MRSVPDSPLTVSGGGSHSQWLDRLHAWRDRLLTSHAFQRFATRFPLTRQIARRKAKKLFDLCTGFVYSQVLLASVRLGLFDQLRAGPRTLDDLAERLDLPRDAAERLLLAAVSLDLVARRGEERFGLGELGAAFLGNPGLDAMVEHHALFYADLQGPVALLRGEAGPTGLQSYWGYAGNDRAGDLEGDAVANYSHLMAATQPMVAAEVLDAYAVGKHRCLMDVGGGEGAFLIQAAKRAPDLRLRLFDLPAVADRARQRLEAEGLSDRAEIFGGDFRQNQLPDGADLISLVRIIHDHDDDVALAILKVVHAALPPGGTSPGRGADGGNAGG